MYPPVSHLSEMGIYNVEFGGVEVKARVVNDGEILSAALAELECDGEHPIVGLDVKKCSKFFGNPILALLILCTSTKCLIIQLDCMRRKNRNIPRALAEFLSDENLCFVCPNGFVKNVRGLSFLYGGTIENSGNFIISTPGSYFKCERIGVVEVGQYAARILKNPKLLNTKSLDKLGNEAGVDLTSSSGGKTRRPKWDAEVFSEEEVRCVMYDAVACSQIVQKLRNVV